MTKVPQQFEITAHPQFAASAREHVMQAAQQVGFSAAALGDIEIAVGEAVTNAILYGSPSATSRIVITHGFFPNSQTFEIEVRDQGRGFDPVHIREEENMDALGGRGIRLMRALMDDVMLQYSGAGMVVRLAKKLTS